MSCSNSNLLPCKAKTCSLKNISPPPSSTAIRRAKQSNCEAALGPPANRVPALGVVLCDEVAQLLDDSVDEFLPVSVRLPELGKDVVLPARLSHPVDKERG